MKRIVSSTALVIYAHYHHNLSTLGSVVRSLMVLEALTTTSQRFLSAIPATVQVKNQIR